MGRMFALVALLAALCLAGPAGATFPGRNGRLAFAGTDLQPAQLGAVTLTGHETPLGQGDTPVPSPDGSKLVFTVGEYPDEEVWIENADGSGRKKTPCDATPSWAPDSRRLTCVDGLNVVVLDTTTGTETKVAEGYAPLWSPEGSWIAYLNEVDGLSVVHPDGTGDTLEALDAYDVTWAPDGAKLAFTSREGEFCAGDEGEPHSVWVVAVPDGAPVELPTDDNTRVYEPVFSADSSHVAYVENFGGPERCAPEPVPPDRVYVAPASGGGRTAQPCEDDPAWSPDAAEIACVKEDTVRVVHVATRSSVDVGTGTFPSWSPDGSLVAFGGSGVSVVRPDGSDRRRLVDAPDTAFYGVRWLRDSSSLVYSSSSGGDDREIFTSEPDGSDVRKLTSNQTEEYDPVWSPNGKRIAYVHEVVTKDPDDADNQELYVMNADGSHKQRLTHHRGFDWQPSWSPDGKRIVFVRAYGKGGRLDLAILDLRTHRVRRLTRTETDEWWPAWSPNGRWIAYVRGDGGGGTLHLISPNGRVRRRRRVGGDVLTPAWAPNGRRIAYDDSQKTPWVTGVTGTKATALAPAELETPAWSPDGSLIVWDGGEILHLASKTVAVLDPLKRYDPQQFDWQRVR